MKALAGFGWKALAHAIVGGTLLLIATSVGAHEWYPATCCSDRDCQEIEASEVKAAPHGWLVLATGEVIPYGDKREQFSPDGKFHRCSLVYAQEGASSRTICLFVPGTAS